MQSPLFGVIILIFWLLHLSTYSRPYLLPSFLPDQAATIIAFARGSAAGTAPGVASLVNSGEVQAAGGNAGPLLLSTEGAEEKLKDEKLLVTESESAVPTAAAEEEEELIVRGSSSERRSVHHLCDQLGLSHFSVGHGDARHVVIRRGSSPPSSEIQQRRQQQLRCAENCKDTLESAAKRQKASINNSDTKAISPHISIPISMACQDEWCVLKWKDPKTLRLDAYFHFICSPSHH
jgi:hypothetical protein